MRTPACCVKEDTDQLAWSNHEDQKLIQYIQKHGKGCWETLPQDAGILRSGKSCRLRWMKYLKHDFKTGKFTEDEEDLIIKLHALLGNRWSLIAGRLPNRTDNQVKNYWNSHLKWKLMKMGIDPNNHRLNHIPYHILNPKSSTSVASSTLKTRANEDVISALNNRFESDNELVSDGIRCFDDKSCRIPDLNLNLSFTMVASKIEEGENHNCKSDESRDSKVVRSPTHCFYSYEDLCSHFVGSGRAGDDST